MTTFWQIVSWACLAGGLTGAVAVSCGRWWGWAVWIPTNTLLALQNVADARLPQALLWTAYILISVNGLLRARRGGADGGTE